MAIQRIGHGKQAARVVSLSVRTRFRRQAGGEGCIFGDDYVQPRLELGHGLTLIVDVRLVRLLCVSCPASRQRPSHSGDHCRKESDATMQMFVAYGTNICMMSSGLPS